MESEYMAPAAAEVQEVIWLQTLLQELRVELSQPVVIREDNKSCQLFDDHVGNFNRTQCIDVRYNIMQERIERGDIHE
jgi:hypothetical protein